VPFHLVVARSGEALGRRTFDQDRVKIGREKDSDLQIDHPTLSRQHAIIERQGPAYTIRDLGSQNGTAVNGKTVPGPVALNEADEIQLGEFTVIFHGGAAAAADVPLVQNQAAYAVFGQTLQVRPGDENEVRERSAAVHAHLVEDASKRTWALDRDVLLMGRGSGCHVRVGGWFAPRIAAAIVRGHGGWSLVKLGPRAVTCKGEKVLDRAWLVPGDHFTVGGRGFSFEAGLPLADSARPPTATR
jgi:pSer/pThr/pTyr-binding forkhead associated (FHA) protein